MNQYNPTTSLYEPMEIDQQPNNSPFQTKPEKGNGQSLEEFGDNLFQAIDLTVKRTMWAQARDGLRDFMLKNFLPSLNFAAQLDKMSSGILGQNNKPRNLEIGEISNTYVRLDKLYSIQEDALRFLPRLEQYLCQTHGRFFLHKDIHGKLDSLINSWISTLYFCRYGNCHDNCVCLEDWFSRSMARPALKNYNYEQLLTEETPWLILQNKIFGPIIKRSIQILAEIDNYIPVYEKIYNFNTVSLLNLLSFNRINFQITHRDGFIYLNIDGQNDRFRIKEIRSKLFPAIKK